MATNQLEFANVVIRTSTKELLDLFDEFVWPAINNAAMRRPHRETVFFFERCRGYSVKDAQGATQALVVGRLIKSTKLVSEQYFDASQGLVARRRSIPSAPSSVFMLHLNTHKLAFLHETAHAPTLSHFANTLWWVLRKTHDERIQRQKAENIAQGTERTMREIREEFPLPDVEVIALSTERSLAEFIETFDKIQSVEVRLVRPNNEIDLNPLFKLLREEQASLKSSQTIVAQRNVDGLDAKETQRYLGSATSQGNALVKLKGRDESGDKLRGDNQSFSVKTVLRSAPKQLGALARRLYGELRRQVRDGNIVVNEDNAEADEKAENVADNLGWPQLVDREDPEDD